MKTKTVREFMTSISDTDVHRYSTYMDTITPVNQKELFLRYIFAYCSIQTGWEMNVKLYNMLAQEADSWIQDKEVLRDILIQSGAGLHNVRTVNLSLFSLRFWRDPHLFQKGSRESWTSFRDRVVSLMRGMGIAKVSFTAEMIYPTTSRVVCLDRHMLRFMGHTKEYCSDAQYRRYEAYWSRKSLECNVPPAVSRWIMWDKIQNKEDSSYWAHVLETPETTAEAV
jgi:hypothetical protein